MPDPIKMIVLVALASVVSAGPPAAEERPQPVPIVGTNRVVPARHFGLLPPRPDTQPKTEQFLIDHQFSRDESGCYVRTGVALKELEELFGFNRSTMFMPVSSDLQTITLTILIAPTQLLVVEYPNPRGIPNANMNRTGTPGNQEQKDPRLEPEQSDVLVSATINMHYVKGPLTPKGKSRP